jgi:hypothetical protein
MVESENILFPEKQPANTTMPQVEIEIKDPSTFYKNVAEFLNTFDVDHPIREEPEEPIDTWTAELAQKYTPIPVMGTSSLYFGQIKLTCTDQDLSDEELLSYTTDILAHETLHIVLTYLVGTDASSKLDAIDIEY